jgi:4'-phosphopantetheinyl transferase
LNGFRARLAALDVGPSAAAAAVWRIRLDLPAAEVDEAAGLLTDEELASFTSCAPRVAQSRIIARGALRLVLSSWVGRPPTDLRFGNDERGRPHLTEPKGRQWTFSVSRSTHCCLIAVNKSGLVGVDVEDVAPLPDLDEIAHHYFARDEAADILRLSGVAKRHAFYRCWVHKEAYLKARGIGLQGGLAGCSIAINGRPTLRRAEADDPRHWTLVTLELGEDLAGAVATRHLPGLSAGA